jgi:DMSO reductase anchor subunit
MNFYWVYNLPNWQFAIYCILFFIFIAVLGLFLLKKVIQRVIIPQAHNDIVSFFMAGLNAIYGITLGLIAVGAWENYTNVTQSVSNEAATLAALYENIRIMPTPLSDTLKLELKEYTEYIINDTWKQQQMGNILNGSPEKLRKFEKHLLHFIPVTSNDETLFEQTYANLSELIKMRQLRINSVTSGLPSPVWYTIFFGAFLNIVITWFFITDKFRVHVLMTSLFAALLGSLIFLVAAMDNPFRGEFSVSSEAFKIVLEKMK